MGEAEEDVLEQHAMRGYEEEAVQTITEREESESHDIAMPPPRRTVPVDHPDAPPSKRRVSEEPPRSSDAVELRLITTTGNGRSVSDLSDIRAVAFCCDACQTVVSLPRIRWANSPEECPNCGARWMRKPSPDGSFPEDEPTYVYRVVSAFRDALQKLIGVRQNGVFHFLIEIGESTNQAKRNPMKTRRKEKARV
jgi:hypothetical protein